MRRAQRLRQRRDFAAVYRHGQTFRSNVLVLRALRQQRPESRFAFAASGRIGNAVVRNRLKRRLREATRSLPVRPGWDAVLSARPAATAADYGQLRTSIADLLARAGALAEDPP